jgi:hypothetical protein
MKEFTIVFMVVHYFLLFEFNFKFEFICLISFRKCEAFTFSLSLFLPLF